VVVAEPAQAPTRTRSRGGSWLLGLIVALVVLGVLAGGATVFTLSVLAPPNRSTPQATVTGYFNALKAQDYARAWQYSSKSHNDPSSQGSYASSLRADDDQLGPVTSVGKATVVQDSSGRATATVIVQRGGSAGTQMTYSLDLALYDGSTWLIDNIANS
jgi:hypothetical protein